MARTLDIEPIDATFGAVVSGIKVAELDEATLHALYDAWLEYALLIFPGQYPQARPSRSPSPSASGRSSSRWRAISNVREDGTLRLEQRTTT